MPTQLALLGEGALATGLAALQIVAWVALGAPVTRRLREPALVAPVALVFGAAACSFFYALLTWSGHVTTAILADVLLSIAALLSGGRPASAMLRNVLRELGRLTVNRAATALLATLMLAAWLLAISPPRDADVMRYHLAHIRQIILDGRWDAIPDYHYALPFGWSLNFLPFERIGLPVGANLLSLGLTAITLAVIMRIGRESGGTSATLLAVGLVIVLQPMALKAATTAHADAYAMFVTAVLAALLLQIGRHGDVPEEAIGFIAFIGFQSRYQAAAIAAAGTAAALAIARHRLSRRGLIRFAGGVIGALVLASPFYLRNWLDFGNPVWPLGAGRATYADRVVTQYEYGLTGHHTLSTYALGLHTLFVDPLLFPVPIILTIALAALVLPTVRRRLPGVAILVVGFVVVWAIAQPRLYSRFTLIIAPAAVLVIAVVVGMFFRRLPVAAVALFTAICLAPVAAFDVYYSLDTVRLLATGDLAAYHRYTWYYPVYTWVNNHTPPNARALVIAQSGLSYYLDRPYRRADPLLSGVVDWQAVHGAAALRRVLARGSYDFVIYDRAQWSSYPGGHELERAIAAGREAGLLRPVKEFDVRLYVSRVRRSWKPAHVTVFAVKGARLHIRT
jgi:hypothetical protein